MTSNEIRNLINKKLVGQGSMIDVGGVLPAVLLNLLDLIEEGGGGTSDAVQYIPQILTSPQQMQARKNQGLYYEETIKGEKTVFTPDTPEYEWPYPNENGISYGDDYFKRMTDDAPAQADIIEMMISGETTVAGSDLQSFDITGSVDFPSTVQGYSANPFVSSRQMFIVVSEDTVVDGNTYKKGIYVPYIQLFANPYVSEITYNGETTTVHQIPQKYIPSGGLQTYDINMDWHDLDDIIRNGYGYGQNNFTEDDYNELCEALANGKMIALNIGSGAYGYPGGKLLTGNYLPLNAQDNDGYISEIIFPVIDWVNYNPNTGTITGSASYIIGLKCGYGVESEEFKYEFVASVVNS